MKKYVVYLPSGKIIKTGICPDSMFSLQAGPGEFVMEGIANDVEDHIDNGHIKKRPQEEVDQIREGWAIQEKGSEDERLIRSRMEKILRDQAIAELKKEGKL